MSKNIQNSINENRRAREIREKAKLEFERQKNEFAGLVSEQLGLVSEKTQAALKELEEIELECAQRMADAKQRVRDTIEDERRAGAIAENLLRKKNRKVQGIVIGQNTRNNKK